MKAIIYRAINNQTGQAYIGATTKSIEDRKVDHEQKADNGTGGYFQNAIATYGADSFHWEQIDTANDENDLAKKEKGYILYHDSKENGYNKDAGGGFKKNIYQYNIESGQLIATYDSLESAALAVDTVRTSISNTCIGQNITCKGFYWYFNMTYVEI